MISQWILALCMAWLLCIPLSANGGTPMIAAGPTSVALLKPDGTVLTWGRDDSGVLGDGRPLFQTTLAQVSGLNVGTGVTQAMLAADQQVLVVDTQNRVWAWGDNADGQLGDGSTRSRVSPALIAGLTGVRAVAAGLSKSLFLKTDGTVWSTNSRGGIEQIRGLSAITAIAAGWFHGIALKSDRTVWTWGLNDYGQLGDGTVATRDVTSGSQVPNLADVTSVGASGLSSFALRADGSVWGWGSNQYVQIADSTTKMIAAPLKIQNLPGAVAIAPSAGTVSALLDDGSVWRWGGPQFGAAPMPISGLSGITRVVMGSSGNLLAQKADGSVWGIGNLWGELGVGSVGYRSTPVQIPGEMNPAEFALGRSASVFVNRDGTVWTAGSNTVGQLGTGAPLYRAVPAAVPGLRDVVAIASGGGGTLGDFCTIALKSDGTLWGWGGQVCLSAFSQLPTSSVPVALRNWSGVSAISVGLGHSLVLKADGTVWAGGSNFNGELGTGVASNAILPLAPVPGLSGVIAVAAGDYYSLALGGDGTLWTWGKNEYGQIGDGTTSNRSSPTQIGNGYSTIAVGSSHTAAIKADGTLWAWGRNDDGQLGDGTTTQRASPVQIGGGYAAVALGTDHTIALKTDGTLWAWGRNEFGQLGDGTTVRRLRPVSIGSGYRVIAVARNMWAAHGTGEASVGVTTDGTVWGWGGNGSGQLGNGTFVSASSPVPVVNEAVTGLLDLDSETSNIIPPAAAPKLVLEARRLGGIAALTLGTNVYFGVIDLGALAPGTFSAANPYKVYVAAIVPAGISGVRAGVYLLDPGRSWSYYASGPLREYASNVTLDQTLHSFVSILEGVDLSALTGTRFLVGYGTDDQEMLAAQRYREVYVVQPD